MSLQLRVRVDLAVLLDPIARDSGRSYSTVDAVTAIEDIQVEGTPVSRINRGDLIAGLPRTA